MQARGADLALMPWLALLSPWSSWGLFRGHMKAIFSMVELAAIGDNSMGRRLSLLCCELAVYFQTNLMAHMSQGWTMTIS